MTERGGRGGRRNGEALVEEEREREREREREISR